MDDLDLDDRLRELFHSYETPGIDGGGPSAGGRRRAPRLALVGTAALIVALGAGLVVLHPAGGNGGPGSGVRDQQILAAVKRAEAMYFLPRPAAGPVIVAYAVTTPARALAYLDGISWSNVFYSSADCHCDPSKGTSMGKVGNDSSQMSLVADETGTVAVVEISGATLDAVYPPGGIRHIPTGDIGQGPPRVYAYQADAAFLVVNLTDGDTTGGMVATPESGTSFDLGSLGAVTTWTGPDDFGPPPSGPSTVTVVDTPHFTSP